MNKHKKTSYSRDPKAYPLMKVLEPRIMFDGAAIFSGLDALDSLEVQKNNSDQTDISQQSLENNQSLFSKSVKVLVLGSCVFLFHLGLTLKTKLFQRFLLVSKIKNRLNKSG